MQTQPPVNAKHTLLWPTPLGPQGPLFPSVVPELESTGGDVRAPRPPSAVTTALLGREALSSGSAGKREKTPALPGEALPLWQLGGSKSRGGSFPGRPTGPFSRSLRVPMQGSGGLEVTQVRATAACAFRPTFGNVTS